MVAQSCDTARNEQPAAPSDVVRIVSSLPQKGTLALQARLISQAIDVAIEQRANSVSGWRIEHVALDGGSDESGDWSRERELANARQAADDPSVVAYIGPYNSGATGVSLPITNKAGLLQLGPTATWPGLTLSGWNPDEPSIYYPSGQRNFARLMPPDSMQADAAARWCKGAGAEAVYVVSDGSSYSDGLAAQFTASAKKVGAALAGSSSVTEGNLTSLASQVANAHPDAVFYAPSSAAQAAQFAKALEDISLPVGVFASDTALSDQFIEAAGGDAHNWFVLFNGWTTPPASQAWQSFSSEYERSFGSKPSQFAGNAYDLTNLVLDAIASGGRDRDKVRQRVMGTKDYQGVTGQITFDANGDTLHWRMSGYRFREGHFELDRTTTR